MNLQSALFLLPRNRSKIFGRKSETDIDVLVTAGDRQPFRKNRPLKRSRTLARAEKTMVSKTSCFSLLHESNTRFIEDMHSRHSSCTTQFAKETGTVHYFGDRSREAHWITRVGSSRMSALGKKYLLMMTSSCSINRGSNFLQNCAPAESFSFEITGFQQLSPRKYPFPCAYGVDKGNFLHQVNLLDESPSP